MTNIDEIAKKIGKNITDLLIEHEKSQQDLADAIGVSKSAVSTWTRGKRIPRMDRVDAMCIYFGCNRSDILGDSSVELEYSPSDEDIQRNVMAVLEAYAKRFPGNKPENSQEYYDDETVRIITDRLRTNPEYGVLFRAAANLKPEDISFVIRLIEKMS